LNQLCDNTGGKVINVYGKSGLLKFNSSDMAKRAMKRLNGEDVFGNKIVVSEKRGSTVDLASQFESIPTSPRKRRGNSESHSYASALAKNTKNIQKLGGGVGCLLTRANREGIKLTITNIDAALGEENIRTLLFTKIGKTCELITLEIQPYNRFTMTADVIVPNMKNATDVLQSLQRQRFGKKRILVTLTQQSDMRMNQFRENLSSLLEDGLPMSFSELQYKYESAFGPLDEPICTLENIRRLGSNFIKIEEACQPYSSTTDLCISLASPIRRRPVQQRTIPQSPYSVILPHCDRHVCLGQPVADCSLVKVTCGLREFAAKLHGLLASHQGILQLSSFDICWKAELGAFPDVQDQKGTIGVYLEHLVSFVPGVEIVTSQHGIKVISWAHTGTTSSNTPCETESDSVHSGCTTGTQTGSQGVNHAQNRARAPLGDPNLVALGKEMTDLLKERKGCVLPLNQLINQFQKKYNRNPFRTGVHPIQTLNKLSHVIQLMGIEGRHETRLVTLTHRAQVKRFTQEVVKILKAQADRKCQAYQLPGLYQDIFKVLPDQRSPDG
jgi:meiosis arrest female protein 1